MNTQTAVCAKWKYRSGFVLLIPRNGNHCMLFLEFLRDFSKENKRNIKFSIRNAGDTDTSEEEYFSIRMEFELKETFQNAVEYINANT